MGLKSGEKGGELSLEFRDPLGVGLGRGKVGHADQILVGHLGVAEHLTAILAGDGQAVVSSRPGQSVVVDVGHGV